MEKASPFSKQNNSPLRNLNAAELTFVSCQVHTAVGVGWGGPGRSSPLNYKWWACHFWTLLKLSGNKIFFHGEGLVLLPTQRVHTPVVSFVMRAAHGGCDSGECPCTITLGGEVEQGRVSGAARVGQSTDLVMAPLFLFLSLSADSFLVFSLHSLDFHLSRCFWSIEAEMWRGLALVHISPMWLCLVCKTRPFPFLFSVCYSREELSGVSARPV